MAKKYKTSKEPVVNRSINNLLMIALMVMVVGFVLLFRMGQLAIMKKVNQVDLAIYRQEFSNGSSIAEARRGNIYDQKGLPIAIDTTSYSLYAVLEHEEGDSSTEPINKERTAKVLSRYIDMTQDQIAKLLNTPDVYQVEFGSAGKNLTAEQERAIDNEHLAGVHFNKTSHRYYINDYFASHLVGFAKEDEANPQEPVGQLGVEALYNDALSGQLSLETEGVDRVNDLYLTLDSQIQNPIEDQMTHMEQTYQPESMGAYVVEVDTGRLLAASQRPSFKLNTLEGIDKSWENIMVETANEPGSTVKILTVADAYDRQVFQPGETFMSGKIQVYDQVVKDYNLYGWGEISFEEGLARSSNVGMVELVNRMGDTEWVKDLEKFGFGQSTQSGFPNEIGGSLDFDNPVSRIMSGFGQGFSATPLQLMQAFTAIANQGQMMKVQFVEGLSQPQQKPTYYPQKLGKIFSSQAADYVLKIMVEAVQAPYGTAQAYWSDQVQVAAKTGTAEIANPEGGGYMTGKNDSYNSVVAFFPADDPQYMVYLFMKRPTRDHGKIGSQILSELFHPILKSIMVNQ